MRFFLIILSLWAITIPADAQNIRAEVVDSLTIDSLGACQGIFVMGDRIFLYGDREVGVIREYKFSNNNLIPVGNEIKLSISGTDVINHPTGICYDEDSGLAFIGNSSRLNDGGTKWKANIFLVRWDDLIKNKTLKNSLVKEINDDACIQGTRPLMVKYNGEKYAATADYGDRENEVRLYDFEQLKKVTKTSAEGVLKYKFKCSPWVQNLFYLPEKDILVLVQNQIEGRYWRLTFVNLTKSVNQGKSAVIKVIDIDKPSELEGFAVINETTALAVTSSRNNNVSIMKFLID